MYSTFLFIYGYLMLVSNLPEQLPNFENELVKHLPCVTTQLLLAFCQKLFGTLIFNGEFWMLAV